MSRTWLTCSWRAHLLAYTLFYFAHIAVVSCAGRDSYGKIKLNKDLDSDANIPNLEDPIEADSQCVITFEGLIVTATGGPPPCQYSTEGMKRCCQCVYGKHYAALLIEMFELWEKFGYTGRLGRTFIEPPNPANLGNFDLLEFIEADDTHRTGWGTVSFRCYLTITHEQQAMFFALLQFRRQPGSRPYWNKKGVAMRTKQLKVNCGQSFTFRFYKVPSLRHYNAGTTSSGLTDAPITAKSGHCVPTTNFPVVLDAEQNPDKKRLKTNAYENEGSSSMVLTPIGATKCLYVPRLQDRNIPSEHSHIELISAVTNPEKQKGLATYENPYEISSDDEAIEARIVEQRAQHAMFDEYPGFHVDSMRLMSTSYEASYPGHYATRTLSEAGPSNFLDFALPRAANFDLNELPTDAESLEYIRLESLQVCASLSASSSQPAFLRAEDQQIFKP